MRRRFGGMKIGLLVVLVAALVAVSAYAVPRLRKHSIAATQSPAVAPPTAQLVHGMNNTLELPGEVVRTMGIETAEVLAAPPPMPLKLDGFLLFDPGRMVHVHTRFAGEVVEIGTIEGETDDPSTLPQKALRPLRFGDKVEKGHLLAVLWSKELGEKKSELVDALSRLTLDRETETRLEELYRKGAIPERSVREAEQRVDADEIAVERAKRTLRTWKLTEEDIDQIAKEASKIHQQRAMGDEGDADVKAAWARVEIRAAIDGVIVEKNIAAGDVVDTSLDMFKIADLNRLDVLAHIYEEDIPLIEQRPVDCRQWRIHLKSDPQAKPLSGRFDQIGTIIDPSQHTALVMGWVDNSAGRLRMGQFITAMIEMPPPPNAVAVPADAMVDKGGTYSVFVQTNPKQSNFTSRPVTPVGHGANGLVYLSTDPPQGQPPESGLKPGDRVVVSGGLELSAALEELTNAGKVAATAGGTPGP